MKPVLAIGPGRCGSMSLHETLKSAGAESKHEGFGMPWDVIDPGKLDELVGWLNGGRANVTHFNLRHLDKIEERVPDLVYVCLHRPRREFLESIAVHTASRCRLWSDYKERDERARWYPRIDTHSPLRAWAIWWEMVEDIMGALQRPAFHIATSALGYKANLAGLFKFVDLEPADGWRPFHVNQRARPLIYRDAVAARLTAVL